MVVIKYNLTIAYMGFINMYSSIKTVTIKIEVEFFSKILTASSSNTIQIYLELLSFIIISTLILFYGWYYK